MKKLPFLLLLAACSPSVSFAPGSHYHCSEVLMEQVGELTVALEDSRSYLKRVESACGLLGNSKDK